MSDYQADSELMRLCDRPYGQPVRVSDDLFNALQIGLRLSDVSDGKFDVSVGPYVRLWRMARKKGVLPTAAQIAAVRPAVGWKKIRLDREARTVTLLAPNMKLDLGGIGKGIAADAALRVLNRHGIDRAVVAGSGDIAIGDAPPGQRGWKVGVAGLTGPTNQLHCLVLHNAGISTSGDAEQFVEINGIRYSHIVDPTTGLGLTNRIQDTVIGPDATTTDSLDTVVNLLGIQRGLALIESRPRTAAVIIAEQNGRRETYTSRRFNRLEQVNQ